MPADFQFGREVGQAPDLYSPIAFTPEQLNPARWRNEFLFTIARLKPNVSIEQAQAELDTIAANVREQFFGGGDANDPSSWGLLVRSMREITVGEIRPALMMLLVAVAFVLLIACANVANLLLARAALRHKEIAIRSALGAARGRVIRQLLTESVLLAIIGGALGLALAYWGIGALLSLNEAGIPRSHRNRNRRARLTLHCWRLTFDRHAVWTLSGLANLKDRFARSAERRRTKWFSAAQCARSFCCGGSCSSAGAFGRGRAVAEELSKDPGGQSRL